MFGNSAEEQQPAFNVDRIIQIVLSQRLDSLWKQVKKKKKILEASNLRLMQCLGYWAATFAHEQQKSGRVVWLRLNISAVPQVTGG